MRSQSTTYSDIIDPALYNTLMTEHHLYIAAADKVLKQEVEKHLAARTRKRVLELGCGPGRITSAIASIPGIDLRAIDHDSRFVEYAQASATRENLAVVFQQADITNYQDDRGELDVCYSQGVHHHIAKGESTTAYLKGVRSMLASDGVFILGDEFLPHYADTNKRRQRAVVWYSHIIAHAQQKGFAILAREEAKTLLDDLAEDDNVHNIKTQQQIDLVIASAPAISRAAWGDYKSRRNLLVQRLFTALHELRNADRSGDVSFDSSRGDYKICEAVFKEELREAGLKIDHKAISGWLKLNKNIGAMVVYRIVKA